MAQFNSLYYFVLLVAVFGPNVQSYRLTNKNIEINHNNIDNTYDWKDGKTGIFVPDKNGQFVYLRQSDMTKSSKVVDTDVQFYYTSRTTKDPVEIVLGEIYKLDAIDFDINRKTMFVIHGWNNDKDSPINSLVPKAVLEVEEYNIFIVNWGKFTHSLYSTAKSAIPEVGEILSRFILEVGQDLSLVTLTGHSLGGHVAGKAGQLLEGKIAVIIGLDPAMPFFDMDETEKRLDPSDAKYVQVIHTCAGYLGFKQAIGHSDFYPNGGLIQPGCGLDFLGICAHERSYEFYVESVRSNNFLANFCEDKEQFESGKCVNTPTALMGGLDLDPTTRGTYYLKTAAKTPFALG